LHEPPPQLSARVVLQAVQTAPAAPHWPAVGVMHWSLLQQPLAQLVAVQAQAPPTHC
jgi:hypothetical protein